MEIKNFGIVTESDYVGLTLQKAEELAKHNGFTYRITELDGTSLMVTADYKSNRLNFRVKKNIIIGVYPG